jgi:hypothetical protein
MKIRNTNEYMDAIKTEMDPIISPKINKFEDKISKMRKIVKSIDGKEDFEYDDGALNKFLEDALSVYAKLQLKNAEVVEAMNYIHQQFIGLNPDLFKTESEKLVAFLNGEKESYFPDIEYKESYSFEDRKTMRNHFYKNITSEVVNEAEASKILSAALPKVEKDLTLKAGTYFKILQILLGEEISFTSEQAKYIVWKIGVETSDDLWVRSFSGKIVEFLKNAALVKGGSDSLSININELFYIETKNSIKLPDLLENAHLSFSSEGTSRSLLSVDCEEFNPSVIDKPFSYISKDFTQYLRDNITKKMNKLVSKSIDDINKRRAQFEDVLDMSALSFSVFIVRKTDIISQVFDDITHSAVENLKETIKAVEFPSFNRTRKKENKRVTSFIEGINSQLLTSSLAEEMKNSFKELNVVKNEAGESESDKIKALLTQELEGIFIHLYEAGFGDLRFNIETITPELNKRIDRIHDMIPVAETLESRLDLIEDNIIKIVLSLIKKGREIKEIKDAKDIIQRNMSSLVGIVSQVNFNKDEFIRIYKSINDGDVLSKVERSLIELGVAAISVPQGQEIQEPDFATITRDLLTFDNGFRICEIVASAIEVYVSGGVSSTLKIPSIVKNISDIFSSVNDNAEEVARQIEQLVIQERTNAIIQLSNRQAEVLAQLI